VNAELHVNEPEAPEELLPAPPAELVISDAEQLKALGDGLRLRLLEVMGTRPRHAWSVKELAEAIGQGQTRLYHHVNLLEARGLLRVARTSVVSGIVERRYQAAALTFRLERSLVAGADGAAAIGQLLDTAVEDTRQQIMASVTSGRIDPDAATPGHRLLLARTRIRLRPEQVEAFRSRLEELIGEDAGGADVVTDAPDAIDHGLLIAFYPVGPERPAEP
jgi:DNA-binding transcriptional ArsR family regulator